METRIEKDTMGEVLVETNKYWGAQTQRSLENFKIGGQRMPLELIIAMAIVKKAAAYANTKLGGLPADKCALIAQVCDEIVDHRLDEHFPLVIWQTGSGTQTNMNVNEVIANRAEEIKRGIFGDGTLYIKPNDDVNKSQSTNDVFPTAMKVAATMVLTQKTLPALRNLADEFGRKSDSFNSIVKIGRTHLMDATPVTLGQEFQSYQSQLLHAIKSVENSLVHLYELPIGGTATGSGLNTPKNYDVEAVKNISEFTQIPFVISLCKSESMAAHDALVCASGALKQTAVSIMKIVNDIRLLASGSRCGIGELSLPENEPGSSIMPGKVNPTQCEALSMVCAQVIGNDVTISIGGMQGHLELNVFMPMMIFNLLQSSNLIADATQSFLDNCVVGIVANKEVIKNNLDNSLMLVTALNPHIGYYNAAAIAQKAHKEGLTLKQSALESGLLTSEEYDLWVDPAKMV
ncbi:MAG: class II fumarate hydratase [Bacteroidota bacterium]